MNVHARNGKARYRAPDRSDVKTLSLRETLIACERGALGERQYDLLLDNQIERDARLYAVGNLGLLKRKCVAIVGTRDVSVDGRSRARRLAKELVSNNIVVVSGLAKGVDTEAHSSAVQNGGDTIAIIGTPLATSYPAENSALQELIYRDHLLISPFKENSRVFRGNFPVRNRVMAALSDATVIIEASDTSGTLHQAAECQRLNRWLFITKRVADDKSLTWPSRFIGKPKVGILERVEDVVAAIQ